MEIIQVLRGRSFRDTLFGKVRYGQAVLQNVTGEKSEISIVIKEYERTLVEARKTQNGELVGENAKEELRIHSVLCSNPYTIQNCNTSAPHLLPTGHPHICHLYDVRKDEQCYYAILEYCARGEFFPLVQHEQFTLQYARHYFTQLILGLQYMHSFKIAHRDLSLENILLDEAGNLKICDFGVAIECKDGLDTLIRDPDVPVGKVKFYMPPEVFAKQAYYPAKVDVWTSGIILFVMLTKVHPFKYATTADQRFALVMNGQTNELLIRWGKEPLSDLVTHLISRMLCPMEKRISIDEILQHPFVRDSIPRTISTEEQNAQSSSHLSYSIS
jgi:calcium-dependent protein kinase